MHRVSRRHGGGWVVELALLAGAAASACWRTGEPTPSPALVTWAAYPESVRVGEIFSFEFAGPVSLTACGRLDSAYLEVSEEAIRLSATRSTFHAVCAPQPVSFYEARPIRIERPGQYAVSTVEGRRLGTLIATEEGRFSRMRAVGEGTVRSVAGCWLFGPGWASNQRPFALLGAPDEIREQAGTDRVVHVGGTLVGFTLCGWYGSRPSIRVDTAWVTKRTSSDYYR